MFLDSLRTALALGVLLLAGCPQTDSGSQAASYGISVPWLTVSTTGGPFST